MHSVKIFPAALPLLLRCPLPAWVPCPPPSPDSPRVGGREAAPPPTHLRGAGEAGVMTPNWAGQGGSSRLPVHMPGTPTHRHAAASLSGRRASLQGGRAGGPLGRRQWGGGAGGQAGGRHRGICQGSGITSSGFSCFIVKQEKTIYTPTPPLNTCILCPLFCGSSPLPSPAPEACGRPG